jgi:[acyl-carrier-protein] S-malonyltransferase
MQADLADHFPVVRDTYAEAGEALGFDLEELVSAGPEDRLNETVNTQPAMLTAGVATWRAWKAAGGADPAMMAGHSLGEYTALVCAGAIEFSTAVALVSRRAELMQSAVSPGEGAMAAILGLDDADIVESCAKASGTGIVEPVNFNSPGQVVVAGQRKAVESLLEIAKEAGARRAIMLAVSVPAHSSLMRPAGETLAADIDVTAIRDSVIPVICAVDGSPYADADDIRDRMKKQVYSPVRWVDTISYMAASGVSRIVECGPGKVLAGLNRRIDRSLTGAALISAAAINDLLAEAGS